MATVAAPSPLPIGDEPHVAATFTTSAFDVLYTRSPIGMNLPCVDPTDGTFPVVALPITAQSSAAGIIPGDTICSVNGQDVRTMTWANMLNHMRVMPVTVRFVRCVMVPAAVTTPITAVAPVAAMALVPPHPMAPNEASLSDESEKPATKKQKTAVHADDDKQPPSTPPELIIQRFRFASVRTSAAAAAQQQQQRLPLALSGAFKGEFSIIHNSGDPLDATGLELEPTKIAPGGPLSAWGFLAVDVDTTPGPGGVVMFTFRLMVDEYEEDDESSCVAFSCAKEDLASIITSRGG